MTTEPTTFDVPGWERPAWATEVSLEHDLMSFTRDATASPDASLVRGDTIRIDAEHGTMSIEQGQTVIYLGDPEEMPVSEARKLAAALIELADYAEGLRQ